jgi:hypothetical protein
VRPHRVRVPTHLLVEPTYALNLWLASPRVSRRQLGAALAALAIALQLVLLLHLSLAWWAVIGAPLATAALLAARARPNGLPLDRRLAVVAAYHLSRPRRARWRPAPFAPPMAAPPVAGAPYRPAPPRRPDRGGP